METKPLERSKILTQFVAVADAAPTVLMARELISA
jgi:hypothetical protein